MSSSNLPTSPPCLRGCSLSRTLMSTELASESPGEGEGVAFRARCIPAYSPFWCRSPPFSDFAPFFLFTASLCLCFVFFFVVVVSFDFHCFCYLFFTRGALHRLLALGSPSAFGMCAIAPFPHTRPPTKGAVGCQWLHRIQRKVEGDVGQGPNHVAREKAGESAPMRERE